MSKRIRHRGPDWSGIYQGKTAILAHERLSIVDPASGGQPLVSPDGKLILCVNGETVSYTHLDVYKRQAFILTHKELYGKYLPFYTPDDHYYDDEVNLEDVRFLLWHYTQQYHGYRKGLSLIHILEMNRISGFVNRAKGLGRPTKKDRREL